jgi:hypothetical protein
MSAEMTLPSSRRDLLMFWASVSVNPTHVNFSVASGMNFYAPA